MSEELIREEVIQAVDQRVEELLQQAELEGPPVNALLLARRHLNLILCIDRREAKRGRKDAGSARPLSVEGQQWVAAHEIGRHFKADILQHLGIEPDQARALSGESLANLFATHLLVPTRWFREEAPAMEYDLLRLKERYRTTSHEVLAWRLLDLSEPCVVAIVDDDHVTKRRSNALRVNRQLSEAEQECQQLVSREGTPQVVSRDGWTTQGWPVEREDGKREILRSVVELPAL